MSSTPLTRRAFLAAGAFSLGAASCVKSRSVLAAEAPLIGYTEYCTNRSTRHANQVTARACVVHADGSGRREVAPELIRDRKSVV